MGTQVRACTDDRRSGGMGTRVRACTTMTGDLEVGATQVRGGAPR